MSQVDARALAGAINFQVGCNKAAGTAINGNSPIAKFSGSLVDYGVMCKHPDKKDGDQCIYVEQTGDEVCPFSGITPISRDWITRWNDSIAAATVDGEFYRSLWVPPEN